MHRFLGFVCSSFLMLPGIVRAEIDFARDVQPLMVKNCYRCHGPTKQEGGLRLDIRRRAVDAWESGEVLKRLTSTDDEKRMPPSKSLAPPEIDTLRKWVAEGLRWPDEFAGKEPIEAHWSFRSVKRPAVPIDRLLIPRPSADRRTLIRRLHLDLIGLPPSPNDVDVFLSDTSPDTYEKLVDRLLASPHFGERWGRHWLDLARFAESDGYENDRIRPDAWRFRDWVVRAFNDDLPFDHFTIEQLAGDLLPNATNDQKIAAGFHRHTLWNSAASADKEEFRTFAVKDRVDTTGMAWMGLTLGCAQCHSHKYDPIAHREYYRLYAFFNRTDDADVKLTNGTAPTLRTIERPTHVHLRGNFQRNGPLVTPGVPEFLPPLRPRNNVADRLDLARWLVEPSHPLTARVAVNHIWQHLFGVGLVSTPENFGVNGSPPKHPELLDWLASEFVRCNWSRKALIRTIVMSKTYQQSANDVQQRYRVEAEIVRDLALSVSGLLSPQFGGSSIVPPFPDGLLDQMFTAEALKMPGADRHRRGIYIHAQRTLPHPTLNVFDGADGNSPCARRDRSITPLQALTLLNDPVFIECAKSLGERLRNVSQSDDERLRFAYSLCFARPPKDRELVILRELIERQHRLGAKEEIVWFGIARTLLNLEEFTTRE